MSNSTLYRVSGLAGILGGIGLSVYQLLHPQRDAASVLSSPYGLIHWFGVLSLVLIMVGMSGVYLRNANRLSKGSVYIYLLTLIGMALHAGGLQLDAMLNPLMAKLAPELQTAGHSHDVVKVFYDFWGPALYVWMSTWLVFTVGTVLFGWMVTRSGFLPKLSGIMIMAGAPLFGAALLAPLPVETAGGIVMGLGFSWLGLHTMTPEQAGASGRPGAARA